jgi:hypothetical protein
MSTLPATLDRPVDSGAAADRSAMKRIVRQVVIAAIAFVLTAAIWEALAARLHARPEVPEPFKSKIDLCLDTPGVNTIFIGSSRYFHGIDPAMFDAQTARDGVPTHSFNLGFDALDFHELRFVVGHVLDDPRSKNLKYLVIEPSLRVRLAPGLEHSQRAIALHDAAGSQAVAELILRGNHDWKRKLYWLYQQASVSAIRLANVGVMTNRYIRPQEPPADVRELGGPGGNGYSGLDPDKLLGPRPTVQSDIDRMMADQKASETTGEARELNDFEVAQLADLQQRAATHGVKLILLAPPTAAPEVYGEFSAVARSKQPVPMLSFADPITYFDLYDPKGFVDPDHISKPVAEKLSLKAADAFSALIRSEKLHRNTGLRPVPATSDPASRNSQKSQRSTQGPEARVTGKDQRGNP